MSPVLKRCSKFISMIITMLLIMSPPGYTLPDGASVQSGSVSIETPDASTMNVNQASQEAMIDWNGFSIGGSETVNFNQLNANALAVNRVTGGSISEILGTLNATGRVWLLNPAGVLFGAGSSVNTAGLLASSLNMTTQSFLDKTYVLTKESGSGTGYVINKGTISVTDGGYVAMLGEAVINEGAIAARLGKAILGAGEAMTLALDSDGMISVVIDDTVKNAAVDDDGDTVTDAVRNSGTIEADGGTVLLTAEVLGGVFTNAVNTEGVVQANSLVNDNGVIELRAEGDDIEVSGTVNAEGGSVGIDTNEQVKISATVEAQTIDIDSDGGANITNAVLKAISLGASGALISIGVGSGNLMIDSSDVIALNRGTGAAQINVDVDDADIDVENGSDVSAVANTTNAYLQLNADDGDVTISDNSELYSEVGDNGTAQVRVYADGAITVENGSTVEAVVGQSNEEDDTYVAGDGDAHVVLQTSRTSGSDSRAITVSNSSTVRARVTGNGFSNTELRSLNDANSVVEVNASTIEAITEGDGASDVTIRSGRWYDEYGEEYLEKGFRGGSITVKNASTVTSRIGASTDANNRAVVDFEARYITIGTSAGVGQNVVLADVNGNGHAKVEFFAGNEVFYNTGYYQDDQSGERTFTGGRIRVYNESDVKASVSGSSDSNSEAEITMLTGETEFKNETPGLEDTITADINGDGDARILLDTFERQVTTYAQDGSFVTTGMGGLFRAHEGSLIRSTVTNPSGEGSAPNAEVKINTSGNVLFFSGGAEATVEGEGSSLIEFDTWFGGNNFGDVVMYFSSLKSQVESGFNTAEIDFDVAGDLLLVSTVFEAIVENEGNALMHFNFNPWAEDNLPGYQNEEGNFTIDGSSLLTQVGDYGRADIWDNAEGQLRIINGSSVKSQINDDNGDSDNYARVRLSSEFGKNVNVSRSSVEAIVENNGNATVDLTAHQNNGDNTNSISDSLIQAVVGNDGNARVELEAVNEVTIDECQLVDENGIFATVGGFGEADLVVQTSKNATSADEGGNITIADSDLVTDVGAGRSIVTVRAADWNSETFGGDVSIEHSTLHAESGSNTGASNDPAAITIRAGDIEIDESTLSTEVVDGDGSSYIETHSNGTTDFDGATITTDITGFGFKGGIWATADDEIVLSETEMTTNTGRSEISDNDAARVYVQADGDVSLEDSHLTANITDGDGRSVVQIDAEDDTGIYATSTLSATVDSEGKAEVNVNSKEDVMITDAELFSEIGSGNHTAEIRITSEEGDIDIDGSTVESYVKNDGRAYVWISTQPVTENDGDITVNNSSIEGIVEGHGSSKVAFGAEGDLIFTDDSYVRSQIGSGDITNDVDSHAALLRLEAVGDFIVNPEGEDGCTFETIVEGDGRAQLNINMNPWLESGDNDNQTGDVEIENATFNSLVGNNGYADFSINAEGTVDMEEANVYVERNGGEDQSFFYDSLRITSKYGDDISIYDSTLRTVVKTDGKAVLAISQNENLDEGVNKVTITDSLLESHVYNDGHAEVSVRSTNGHVNIYDDSLLFAHIGMGIRTAKVAVEAGEGNITIGDSTLHADSQYDGTSQVDVIADEGYIVLEDGTVKATVGNTGTAQSTIESKNSNVSAYSSEVKSSVGEGDATVLIKAPSADNSDVFLYFTDVTARVYDDGFSKIHLEGYDDVCLDGSNIISTVDDTDSAEVHILVNGNDIRNYTLASASTIQTNLLHLEAGGAIGSSETPVETDVDYLEAIAHDGGVYIDEADGVELRDIQALGSTVDIDTHGDTVVNDVVASGNGAADPAVIMIDVEDGTMDVFGNVIATNSGDGNAEVLLTAAGGAEDETTINIVNATVAARAEGNGASEVYVQAYDEWNGDDTVYYGHGIINVDNSTIEAQSQVGIHDAGVILEAHRINTNNATIEARHNDTGDAEIAFDAFGYFSESPISAVINIVDSALGAYSANGQTYIDMRAYDYNEFMYRWDSTITIDPSTIVSSADTDGSIYMEAGSIDLIGSTVESRGTDVADVVMFARDGSISADQASLVRADQYFAFASENVGTQEAPINTDVNEIAAYSWGEGDVCINESNDIRVGIIEDLGLEGEEIEDVIFGISTAANDGIVSIISQGDMFVHSIIAPRGGVYLQSANGSIYAAEGWCPISYYEELEIEEIPLMDVSNTYWYDYAGIDTFHPFVIADGLGGPNVIAGGYSYFSAPEGTIGVGADADNKTPGMSGGIRGIVRPGNALNAQNGVDPSVDLDLRRVTPPGTVLYEDTILGECIPVLFAPEATNAGPEQLWPDAGPITLPDGTVVPRTEAPTGELDNPLQVIVQFPYGEQEGEGRDYGMDSRALPEGFEPASALTLEIGGPDIPIQPDVPEAGDVNGTPLLADPLRFKIPKRHVVEQFFISHTQGPSVLTQPQAYFYHPLVQMSMYDMPALGTDVYEYIDGRINPTNPALMPFLELDEKKKKEYSEK